MGKTVRHQVSLRFVNSRLSFVLIFLSLGCQTTRPNGTISYHDLMPAAPLKTPLFEEAVTIDSFRDYRQNETITSQTTLLLRGLLFPGTGYDQEFPVGVVKSPSDPLISLPLFQAIPLALSEDLKARHIFGSVETRMNAPLALTIDKPKTRWRIIGLIHEARQNFNYQGYLLPLVSPYLWMVGLPIGKFEHTLELELKFEDIENDKTLLQKKYRVNLVGEARNLYNLQKIQDRDAAAFNFAQTTGKLMEQFVVDLQKLG